jgi:signal peptide peptidase SppA
MTSLYVCTDDAEIERIQAAMPGAVARPMTQSRSRAVAVMDVSGPHSKRGSETSWSTKELSSQIKSIAGDRSIASFVLELDCPGGSVPGVEELSRTISDCAQAKPVHVLGDGIVTSGAYWAVCCATKIWAVSRTTRWGSIGVVALYADTSEMLAKLGIKIHRVRSGELKGAGSPGLPISADELAQLRKEVLSTADEFINAVMVGRKLPRKVVEELATGATWSSPDAIRLGLVDGYSTLEKLIGSQSDETPGYAALASAGSRFSALVDRLEDGGMGQNQAFEFARASDP